MVLVQGCREDDGSPTAPESAAVVAGGPLAFRQISQGTGHACGVTTENRAYCWGINYSGELGTGYAGASEVTRPVAAAGHLRFLHVRAGAGYTCGLTTGNRVYCWGSNTEGQLGDGTGSLYSLEPVQVAGGRSYRLLRTGAAHACAITLSNATFCWGSNDYGQVGDGTTTDRRAPVKVAGGVAFLRVSAGGFHTCGVTSAKKAYCWGWNRYGQLGNRSSSTTRLTPGPVSDGLAFRLVSAGGAHTCGVTPGNKAYCWGWNRYGQLGDGTKDRRSRPTAVAGGMTFRGVSPGAGHTCGVTTSNAAYCWGYNWYGQVGDGTDAGGGEPFVPMRLTPVAVAGGLLFDAVLAANGSYGNFTCGVTRESRG
jgi:alpha-tubulin suppressor-like RCC1 family protein